MFMPTCFSKVFASHCFAFQAVLEQEARIAGFKSEVSKSQELHLASLTRDTERLTNNLEKIRAEIRYFHSSLLPKSLGTWVNAQVLSSLALMILIFYF